MFRLEGIMEKKSAIVIMSCLIKLDFSLEEFFIVSVKSGDFHLFFIRVAPTDDQL